MTTYEWITTFLAPVTGLIGWFAGTRMRRNQALQHLQTTIDLLSEKNRELYDEVVKLRDENILLKDTIARNTAEIASLKSEIERMRQ